MQAFITFLSSTDRERLRFEKRDQVHFELVNSGEKIISNWENGFSIVKYYDAKNQIRERETWLPVHAPNKSGMFAKKRSSGDSRLAEKYFAREVSSTDTILLPNSHEKTG